MEKIMLSHVELLMVEQLCLEGASRCAQRASLARRKADFRAASYENRLKHRYTELRKKVSQLDHDGSLADEAHPGAVASRQLHTLC
jgi:hypothetical protein